jgi:hypothetical protein
MKENDGTDAARFCLDIARFSLRSYWIPGSYAPTLSENHDSFLKLWKNKDFKEERMTKVELYAIGKSTTLESNKSLVILGEMRPCSILTYTIGYARITVHREASNGA